MSGKNLDRAIQRVSFTPAEYNLLKQIVKFLSEYDIDWLKENIFIKFDSDLDSMINSIQNAKAIYDTESICEMLVGRENAGYKIEKARLFNINPKDHYLFVVRGVNSENKYVVWAYNASINTFFQGRYTGGLHDAIDIYERRGQ